MIFLNPLMIHIRVFLTNKSRIKMTAATRKIYVTYIIIISRISAMIDGSFGSSKGKAGSIEGGGGGSSIISFSPELDSKSINQATTALNRFQSQSRMARPFVMNTMIKMVINKKIRF